MLSRHLPLNVTMFSMSDATRPARPRFRFLIALTGLAMALLFSPSASAAVTVYTNEAAFLSAAGLMPIYLNEFTNFEYQAWLAHDIHASSKGISYYIATTPPVHVVASPGAVSTVATNDQLVAAFTSGNVTGVGGYFYAADTNAAPLSGEVTVRLSDGTSTNVSSTIGATPLFTGFISDGPIFTSFTLTNSSGLGLPALSHFYVVDGIPAPAIMVTVTNTLVISWYSAPTGFVLQASSQPTGAAWTNLNLTPRLMGSEFQAVLPLDGGARFFRLAK